MRKMEQGIMNQSADREPDLFSPIERENRTGHFTACSRTGRTALEQLEQVNDFPKRTCSPWIEQECQKQPLLKRIEKTTCSKGLEQLKSSLKAPNQSRLFALFILPGMTDKRLTTSPMLLPVKFWACRLLRRVLKCGKNISNCN